VNGIRPVEGACRIATKEKQTRKWKEIEKERRRLAAGAPGEAKPTVTASVPGSQLG
jgi:hypothetical protein